MHVHLQACSKPSSPFFIRMCVVCVYVCVYARACSLASTFVHLHVCMYVPQVRTGLYYNPYFPGGSIAMPKMLVDGGAEYDDGTPASESQQAKDVTTFLTWSGYPFQVGGRGGRCHFPIGCSSTVIFNLQGHVFWFEHPSSQQTGAFSGSYLKRHGLSWFKSWTGRLFQKDSCII